MNKNEGNNLPTDAKDEEMNLSYDRNKDPSPVKSKINEINF